MSYHPITMDALASTRRADLLREADDASLAQQALLLRATNGGRV